MTKNNTPEDVLYNKLWKACEFINRMIDNGCIIFNSDGEIQTGKFEAGTNDAGTRYILYKAGKNRAYYLLGGFIHRSSEKGDLNNALELIKDYRYVRPNQLLPIPKDYLSN
jgi:hypothetical protein